MIEKTQMTVKDKKFDLKFLLVSDPGGGKTHFCASYDLGPVHFYMLDPGGEKTIEKLLPSRKYPLTIDYFNQDNTYQNFWKQLQKDQKAGFFKDMAEQNGLVVLPDSLTAANDMIITQVAKNNNRDLLSSDKLLRIQDWGQIAQWCKTLINTINALPCAVAVPAHLYVDTNDDGTVSKRYPAITGQFRTQIGRYFSEIYLLYSQGRKRMLCMTEAYQFQATSRVFKCDKIEMPTLSYLAQAYMNGNLLDEESKKKR